jgi:hypothetical protein
VRADDRRQVRRHGSRRTGFVLFRNKIFLISVIFFRIFIRRIRRRARFRHPPDQVGRFRRVRCLPLAFAGQQVGVTLDARLRKTAEALSQM